MMATLLLAQGTPMLTAGDEWGRSQQGNNNAYCQDNALSWLDWKQAQTPQAQTLLEMVRRLLALRLRLPSLGANRFSHGNHEPAAGIDDIAWFDTDGKPPSPEGGDPESARWRCAVRQRRRARNAPNWPTAPRGEDRPARST